MKPPMKTFCVRHCLQEPFALQQCLILDYLLGIVTENAFYACLFLESIKILNLRYKTSFSKNPNHSRQLTVPTILDSALCLCAARLY